jgi:hypothetical protein
MHVPLFTRFKNRNEITEFLERLRVVLATRMCCQEGDIRQESEKIKENQRL